MSIEKFNSDLLVVARDYRGLSQTQLSNQSGISQGYLSKLENGLIEPDDIVLQKLSNALNFPVTFFGQSERVYGAPISIHPMYRKRANVPKRSIDKITAELNIRLFHIRRLLRSIEFEHSMSVPRYDIEDFNGTASEVASYVRRAWLIPNGPIKNLTELLEQAGVLVIWCDFSYANIDGLTISAPNVPACIFLNRNRPADRMRFSLAHELGHIVMHNQPTEIMEDEANSFASTLLMPEREFALSCGRVIDIAELARLKAIWRVSMQAALYRAKEIELVTYNQATHLWRKMSALGYRKQEPSGTEFPKEKPSVLPKFLSLHIDRLGYTFDDLAVSLNIFERDFFDLYDLDSEERPKLRLVK